jgi:hypothetical protein
VERQRGVPREVSKVYVLVSVAPDRQPRVWTYATRADMTEDIQTVPPETDEEGFIFQVESIGDEGELVDVF